MLFNYLRYILIFTLGIFVQPLVAGGDSVEVRVADDVVYWQSLQKITEQIQNHDATDFVTVGGNGDAACDYNLGSQRIQEAIDSGTAEVRIADNHTYQENLILGGANVIIRAGFTDCATATSNEQDLSIFTEIDGSTAALPVVSITNSINRHLIRLENLGITGGTAAGVFGGGISMELANVELQLVRVVVTDNNAQFGGGIGIDAGVGSNNQDTVLIGQDVFIQTNTASIAGGGIYCAFAEHVVFFGLNAILNNTARLGGGMYARNGCDTSMYTEALPGQFLAFAGFLGNTAEEEGGGVYMTSGADLYLFGQQMCADGVCLGDAQVPLLMWMNESDSDAAGEEDGGAIYMSDSGFSKVFFANGTIFQNNTAGGDGGAAYVSGNSVFTMARSADACWNAERCNYFLANRTSAAVGFGGAIYNDGATVDIANTYFEENRADFATAIYSTGGEASTRIEGGVFNDNGDNGADGFSDNYVLHASLGAKLSILHSTLVDNDAEGAVINIEPALSSSLDLQSSIVHDPTSGPVLSPVSSNVTVRCLLAHESGSFSGNLITVGDPEFIDRFTGDFRLHAQNSPAVDYCNNSTVNIQHSDIDFESRGWDDPDRPNSNGPFDLGANETYDNDILFKDGLDG
ncbi:hypothetical protein [Marinicella sp. W31]|uniref:hypothetical protein n=1 Tax=Marinicella sp. W31 TaxID=3023713 RepID=UPI003756CA66